MVEIVSQPFLSQIILYLLVLTAAATTASKASGKKQKRDEEYQPLIARQFPHLLGPKRMLSWMNQSIDPCDDFYHYACGGFTKLYEDVPHADTLELMQTSNSLLMEQILSQKRDRLSKSLASRRIFQKSIDYYQSCLDSDRINQRGFAPIVPLAKQFADLFSESSFTEAFAKMNLNAVYFLFKTSYGKVENDDPSDMRLQFYPAEGYDVTLKTIMRALQPFVDHGVLDISGATTLKDIAIWIRKLEKMTAGFVKTLNSRHSFFETPNAKMTLAELSNRTGMDWSLYLKHLNMTGVTKVYLWGSDEVWIKALKAINTFDRKAMQYVALWRLATTHYSKLGKNWYNLWAKRIWPNAIIAQSDEDADERGEVFQTDCVRELGIHMNYLSGHLFNQYTFNATQRASATLIIDRLFEAYRDILANVTWMDKSTREAAIRKLDKMIKIVGYPDWVGNATEVDNYYANVNITKGNYFENALSVHSHYEYAASIHQVGRTVERKTVFFGFPWQLNAFHLSDLVMVQINSGILQRPIFSDRNPNVMNYASLGMIVGHEITHAFDSFGHRIDADGIQKSWWSAESNKRFNNNSECFQKQYSNYTVQAYKDGRTMKVEGYKSVSENIADNGGLSVALRAWRKDEGVESSQWTPSDEFHGFSPLQAFFITFAQTWCEVPDYSQVRFLLTEDSHAPNEVRIRGTLSNSKDFAQAFQCKKGTVMNPSSDKQRCHLY